jgi:polyphosphate kinase
MPRNFFRRIETVMPVEEPGLRDQVNQILATQLADNTKAWTLNADGTYLRPARRDGKGRNSQAEFMALAQGTAVPRKKQPIKERFPTLEVAPPPT